MRIKKSKNPNYDPIKQKNAMLRSKYSITLEEKRKIIVKQKGLCGICKIKEKDTPEKDFFVDHDHKTGMIREMLCNSCNVALGNFLESKKLIQKAIEYLKKSKKKVKNESKIKKNT